MPLLTFPLKGEVWLGLTFTVILSGFFVHSWKGCVRQSADLCPPDGTLLANSRHAAFVWWIIMLLKPPAVPPGDSWAHSYPPAHKHGPTFKRKLLIFWKRTMTSRRTTIQPFNEIASHKVGIQRLLCVSLQLSTGGVNLIFILLRM